MIGGDAADWKVITRLMDAGKMPNLQKFVERTARKLLFVQGGRFAALLGIGGALASFYPVLIGSLSEPFRRYFIIYRSLRRYVKAEEQ
ncbi:MAG TPA: hypothetical protein DDW68_04950 [Verrucomicrobiales bacterium]|nr:hypothetical protein [Verrucomicrobiales bacterium]HBE96500.1 hypothetical protein [Verrucomicrobiales bacterium]